MLHVVSEFKLRALLQNMGLRLPRWRNLGLFAFLLSAAQMRFVQAHSGNSLLIIFLWNFFEKFFKNFKILQSFILVSCSNDFNSFFSTSLWLILFYIWHRIFLLPFSCSLFFFLCFLWSQELLNVKCLRT